MRGWVTLSSRKLSRNSSACSKLRVPASSTRGPACWTSKGSESSKARSSAAAPSTAVASASRSGRRARAIRTRVRRGGGQGGHAWREQILCVRARERPERHAAVRIERLPDAEGLGGHRHGRNRLRSGRQQERIHDIQRQICIPVLCRFRSGQATRQHRALAPGAGQWADQRRPVRHTVAACHS